jgi:hypothetical protein
MHEETIKILKIKDEIKKIDEAVYLAFLSFSCHFSEKI